MSTLWPFCSLPHVIRSSFSSLQRNKLCFHEKVPAGLGSPEAHRLVTESLAPERKQSDASYFKNDLTWHIVVKADMKICGNRSYVK
ncbi:hypothetical protein F2P81_008254 [Scophthalmus maximus]|uniref:Uncharacterized protein n=1 Tax=Scophthalmus maximus TaxID=52904 RepID=A0A6A4T523_SCOMX|nr:hypothetical protein F2P81_008254 [Scophthalmus maximus]